VTALGREPRDHRHRYALSIDGVDTLVLGVKNRRELRNASLPRRRAAAVRSHRPD